MKLKVKLSVSDADFYKVLMDSATTEILHHTGKKTKPYVGMEYKRKLTRIVNKAPVDTLFKFVEVEENKKYVFHVLTPVETTIIEYSIQNLSDNKIEVSYLEDIQATQTRIYISQKIIRFLMSLLFAKRRMKKKLRQIESYIIANNI